MSQLVTYEYPVLNTFESTAKPLALANKSFPYNNLANDRRFEELLYNLTRAKIMAGTFSPFDNISLMSGVRDKGRDCALMKGGKNFGLIQCKMYNNNLSKALFGEEITKFIMYSLLDNSLIADRNDFSYYIAVSKGFVLECSDFIDNFNILITTETDLGTWIAKNLRHPTLAPLEIDSIESEVRQILTKIKVHKIYPQDLDAYLCEQSCIHLQPLFFEIRVLIDNRPLDQLVRELQIFNNNELNKEQLAEQLTRGSSSLKHEKNEFEEIVDSHIPRNETAALLRWVENPVAKDKNGKDLNICLLAGNAGMGKTVILKDLYDELTIRNIPVLGLKADKLYAASITELQEKIGLSIPVFQFVEQCKQKYKQVILVIDQIDALSQAMSADRSFLEVYKSLIDHYVHDPNVRIIISVRIFDLHYDPSLRVYKNIEKIEVAFLSEMQVLGLVIKIGIKSEQISIKLMRLLRVPNQLNIFTRIASNFIGILGITDIQELYNELWKQKVLIKPRNYGLEAKRMKQLLYKLAKQMYHTQRISVAEQLFEIFAPEISYLESERILKKEKNQIQFFHQSFYDFVFAKRFVEKNENLTIYIKNHEQSILVRSAVKMILNYLRDYDHDHYVQLMTSLLSDQEIYYHVKHMLISMMAVQEQPSAGEKKIIRQTLIHSIHLTAHFFDQARSGEWFDFAINSHMLSFLRDDSLLDSSLYIDIIGDSENDELQIGYLRHTARIFLSHFIQLKKKNAWDFLSTIKSLSIVRSILYDFNSWNYEPAYEILENCGDFEDYFGFLQILEKIAAIKPEYVWLKIKDNLLLEADIDDISHKDYEVVQLLNILSISIPELLIGTLEEIIVKHLHWENILKHPLVSDYTFTRVYLQDSQNLYGHDYLYQLLAICLRRAAKKKYKEFKNFLLRHNRSNHKAMLRLIVFALVENEVNYSTEVYELFCYFQDIGELKEGENLMFEFRMLFGTTFPHFNTSQQAYILTSLKTLINKDETFVFNNETKPYLIQYWGRGKYAFLLKLPQETIIKDIVLKRQFQELERKFDNYNDKSNLTPIMANIVGTPLSSNAYSKMTEDQWLSSFRKYNGDKDQFSEDYLKGDIDEHSSAFKDAAGKGPAEQMFSIIERAITEKGVKIIYPIKGLWGLAESDADKYRVIEIMKKLLVHPALKNEARYFLYFIKRLISGATADPVLIEFLIAQAKNYDDIKNDREALSGQTQISGMVTRAINTTNGSAAQALLYVQDPAMEDQVFKALEKSLSTAPKETRAALYFRFAYLNHLNRQRAYELFRDSLVKETDIYIIASSIWSLQFMGNYDFSGLKPVYDKLIIADNLGNDDTHWLVSILYFSYLFNKPGAEELLFKLLDHNPKSRSWTLSEACKHYYHNKESAAKTQPLLMHLLTKFANDPKEKMEIRFFHIDHIKLVDIYNFIEVYIDSLSFSFSGNLLKYLTQQCSSFPIESIELFNHALSKMKSNGKNIGHMLQNEDYTKFIVGAFNAINGKDETSKNYRRDLLASFDIILKDYRFKSDTEKVLEELL